MVLALFVTSPVWVGDVRSKGLVATAIFLSFFWIMVGTGVLLFLRFRDALADNVSGRRKLPWRVQAWMGASWIPAIAVTIALTEVASNALKR